jgi:hypothetical protein
MASSFTLHPSPLDPDNLLCPLRPPHDLAELNKFENDVDLHDGRVIDDLQQGYDIGMDGLLQDGDLLLDLVLWIAQFAKPSTFGVSSDDLDGHLVSLVEVPPELDLAVNATTQFVDDLILIQ